MQEYELNGRIIRFHKATFMKWVEKNLLSGINEFEVLADYCAMRIYGRNAIFFVNHDVKGYETLFGQVMNKKTGNCLTPLISFKKYLRCWK